MNVANPHGTKKANFSLSLHNSNKYQTVKESQKKKLLKAFSIIYEIKSKSYKISCVEQTNSNER